MDREAIYSALFALVSSIPGIVTASRRLVHWTDVPAVEQPAIYQAEMREGARRVGRGYPAKWTLGVSLFLYVNVGNDKNAVPSMILNPLIDAVVAQLEASASQEEQTLGGLVSSCHVDGEILIAEGGALGPQAAALIPVEIIVS
ncbi:MAG: hypothetical protein ACLPT6_13305 [Desulfobaccales bacterium]